MSECHPIAPSGTVKVPKPSSRLGGSQDRPERQSRSNRKHKHDQVKPMNHPASAIAEQPLHPARVTNDAKRVGAARRCRHSLSLGANVRSDLSARAGITNGALQRLAALAPCP